MQEKKEKNKIPEHVGVIMDGNRRWAKERNLPVFEGHKKGYVVMKRAVEWFIDKGVKYVSVYVFSSENWQRSQTEVNFLMKLLKKALSEDFDEFNSREYRVVISGRIEELPGDLPELCSSVESKTRDNSRGTLNICLNYGGQNEIMDAIKKMIDKKITVDQVHEGMLRKYLYHGEVPDPGIVIRTSGEQRLSGFLSWQCGYSELIFLQKFWPDFEKADVEFVIEEYNNRKRRFGVDD